MVNAQEWLDKKYPTKESKFNCQELIIDKYGLEGSLSLEGFENLEKIVITKEFSCLTDISSLNLKDCRNLSYLDCSAMELTDLELLLSQLNPKKLTYLNLHNNNFLPADLAVFSDFVNLEVLDIGTADGKIMNHTQHEGSYNYNRFYGSLESLKNLTKLKELCINHTDVESGLEYLPENFERIECWSGSLRDAKVKKIEEQLNSYDHNYQSWRKDNSKILELSKHLTSLQKELEDIKNFLDSSNPHALLKEQLTKKEESINNLKVQIASEQLNINRKNQEYKDWIEFEKEVTQDDFFSRRRRSDYKSDWKKHGFNPQEAKSWIEAGLKCHEHELAAYSRGKKYEPSETNLEEARKEFEEWENTPRIAQEYLNTIYPKEKREQIKGLDIRYKKLEGELDLRDFVNLESLGCLNNKLTSLNLSGCSKLETLVCSDNHLTQILYPPNPELLTFLSIDNNDFPEQELTIFSQMVNLRELFIGDNRFVGSLKPLRNLNKLEWLVIRNTDIDKGLEWLSDSVEKLDCSFTKEEAKVSDIYEELQSFVDANGSSDLQKWREAKWNKNFLLATSPLLPPQLAGELEQRKKFAETVKEVLKKQKENLQKQEKEKEFLENIQEFKYDKIDFNQWKISELPPKELPLRLYSIKTGQIEETEGEKDRYAILSYVWGKKCELPEAAKRELDEMWDKSKLGFKNEVKGLGYKSWKKAIETCCRLKIDYLWMDQLCINQAENSEETIKEMNQEVSKMRKYYSNAEATLISLNEEVGDINNIDLIDILKKIVESEWFSRSWTFQEGWLSKHTLFMFEDRLVDGWAMAGIWALNQASYTDVGKYNGRSEFSKGTKKIATPVGWVYYRNGYNENDKVEMTLNQALRAVKKRGRSIPIDGIYSVLGLLPYGDQVTPKYKKFGDGYTKEELNEALYEVMRVAVGGTKYISGFGKRWGGYCAEPLAWHGASNLIPELCWMPQIDESGSTSVEGGISVKVKGNEIAFTKSGNGVEVPLGLTISYVIQESNKRVNRVERGLEVGGGLYSKDVKVKLGDEEQLRRKDQRGGSENEESYQKRREKLEKNELTEITLVGTKDTLNHVQEGNFLVVFDKEIFASSKPFALLAKKVNKEVKIDDRDRIVDIYQRLGLIELDSDKLQIGRITFWWEETILIGYEQEHQAQIQIPPK